MANEEQPKTLDVEIVEACVANNSVFSPGDVITVPFADGNLLISIGRAKPATPKKAPKAPPAP